MITLAGTAAGQRSRDPLNQQEVDQLRDTAQEPEKRLKLYVKFTAARLLAIDQLRADPKMAPDRGQRIHDLLQDVNTLVNEVEDNVDQYDRGKQDLRKSLKPVIEAATDWQLRLRSLKAASGQDAQAAKESRDYYFVLDTAIDSVNELADDARQTLADQNSRKKH